MYQYFAIPFGTYDHWQHFQKKLLVTSFAEFLLGKTQRNGGIVLRTAFATKHNVTNFQCFYEIAEPTCLDSFSDTFWAVWTVVNPVSSTFHTCFGP